MPRQKPAIIVISSHVVRGTVGNRAAAFALEVLGFPVWIVPTVTLPWHPGHGPAGRIVPPKEEFVTLLEDLSSAPWLGEVGAVLSGYLGSAEQVEPVAALVDAVKEKNPDALYVLDPVMGDQSGTGEGRLYVGEEQASAMRDTLLGRADLVTPNPFELGWLSKRDAPSTMEQLVDAAKALAVDMVLATSAPAFMKGNIGNVLVQKTGGVHLVEHRLVAGPPNGLGDLAAALMLGNQLAGKGPVDALCQTASSLFEVMSIASRAGANELNLEASTASLIRPQTSLTARSVLIGKS